MSKLQQFETIFEHANEAIVISNDLGEITRVNPSGLKLFGYEKGELKNKGIDILIPNRYHHHHHGHVNKYHEKPVARAMGANVELFGIKKNGTEFPVEVSLSPYDLDGEHMVVSFIIDITERRKGEKQLKNYQKELEQEVADRTLILKEAISNLENTKKKLDRSLKKERELNQLKTKFISTASHEFRTPLATVLSSLSLVEKYAILGEKEKGDKHIKRIKNAVRNLTEILDDILLVNIVEEGRVMINPRNFSFNHFIKEIISEVETITKDGQSISLSYENEQEIDLFQDPKLLRHIILNLLSNAIKFSGENKCIEIDVKSENKWIFITIIDHGIGIPENDIPDLFTRFFRAENAGQIQGTGLGLSIVQQYSKLLNGDVFCKSEENSGCEFTVKLPKELEK